VASQSCRNIIAALSLCESCAASIRNSNGKKSDPSKSLTEIIEEIEQSAHEARKQWSAELTKREADKIAECMRQADLVSPEFNGNLAEHTTYYTSLALGLLDELFKHIQDPLKLELLERVERAIWHLHRYFDRNLDRFAIYKHASLAVSIWLECFNG